MYYETTLYIKQDLCEKLDDAAEKMNVSRSALVAALLREYMKRNRAGDKAFMKLKYQDSDGDTRFMTKSICLRKDIYELWCNVRKVYKLSASLLIALAIEFYLNDLLEDKKPFNYGSLYVSRVKYYDCFCVNTIIWGQTGIDQLRDILYFPGKNES